MPILEAFCHYIEDEIKAKRLAIPDPEFAGRQLFGMIKENLVYPVWFGTRQLPSKRDKSLAIQKCLDLFLSYYESSPL